jgi:Cysteine-rich secretory protein family
VALPAMTSPPVHLATSAVASGGWLTRFNTWRASTGLPLLTENSTWSAGDYNHAVYMVKNDLVTHYETPGVPYYTTSGDTEARNSNIQVSSTTSTTDVQAIDWWMAAPFHAMNMMDPRLTQTGFGSYRDTTTSPWQEGGALDTIQGNSFSGGSYPVYFPGNGTTEPLTTYSGGEFPDPLQACPGYSVPTGLPVFIQVGGNVNTVAGPVHSFTGNGVPLNHCVIDSTNPAVGSYLVARGGVILIPQTPLQSGVKYAAALTVNGQPYTWSFTVGPFIGCPFVIATAAPPSPSLAGTTIKVVASATACANPLYEFWVLPPGGSAYQLGQAYSNNATFSWNTSGLAPGDYRFSVWARDANSTGLSGNQFGRWDAYDNSLLYTLTTPACSGLSASPAPMSPAGIGTTVTVTAQASGCTDLNPVYQFWVLPPGGNAYLLQQAYSTSRTFTWNTTGLTAGDYHFSIWARDASSTGVYGNQFGRWDTYNNSILYTLTAPACSGLSASAAPASAAGIGTTVAIHAQAGGCPDPNPLYQFWVLPPGGTTYQLGQAYSTSSTFSWSTSGLAPGSYRFSIWARDANSSGAYGNQFGRWDSYNNDILYTLTSCSGLQVSVSPASPAARGTTVTVTAQASGCPDPNPQYQFWVLPPGGTAYQLAQAYSASSTFTWNTTGLAPGSYRFSVWVRDTNSAGEWGNQFGRWDAYNGYTVYTLS